MGTNTCSSQRRKRRLNRNLLGAVENGVLDFFSLRRFRLIVSISTVRRRPEIPRLNASPPSVMMFEVSPSALITMIEVRIDSGIEPQ